MNEAEKTLWLFLRDRKRCRFKFRRQHPIGPYTADFWCAAAKLVVELDGLTHAERKQQDKQRDEWMTEQGIEVLRIKNRELEGGPAEVLKRIEAACERRIA